MDRKHMGARKDARSPSLAELGQPEPFPQPRAEMRGKFEDAVVPHQPNHIPSAVQNRSAVVAAGEMLLQPLASRSVDSGIQVLGNLADHFLAGQVVTTPYWDGMPGEQRSYSPARKSQSRVSCLKSRPGPSITTEYTSKQWSARSPTTTSSSIPKEENL